MIRCRGAVLCRRYSWKHLPPSYPLFGQYISDPAIVTRDSSLLSSLILCLTVCRRSIILAVILFGISRSVKKKGCKKYHYKIKYSYKIAARMSSLSLILGLLLIRISVAARPEVTLLNVFGRPFAPIEGASAKCLQDSALYLEALEQYSPWALQMYDSSAKIPPGVITGNTKQLGNYDECLRVETGYDFDGQACSATVQFVLPENATSADDLDARDLLIQIALAAGVQNWTSQSTTQYEGLWCLPSSCNSSEVAAALDAALDPLRVKGRVEMTVSVVEDSCHTSNTDKRYLDQWDVVYIAIMGIFLVIVIASTTYDLIKFKHESKTRKDTRNSILTSFSIYTNGKSLLNTERRADSIRCLDGLRFLSICWIIYGHNYYLEVMGVKLDLLSVPRFHENISSLLVLNGNIATDTFLLISGTLLAYIEFSQKQKNPDKTLNILGLYAHRYMRLTPAYAMAIGFYATLFYKIGSGPHWNNWIGTNAEYCRKNWWANLLYVNNYVNIGEMCLSQSWYLSVDMQLVWLSPIFLYPMLKFKRSIFFWSILGTGIVVSILAPFFITYLYGLTGTMLYTKNQIDVTNVYLKIYVNAYTRAGPHIIGLGLGYLLCKTRSRSFKILNRYVAAGWLIAIASGLAVVFGPLDMYYPDYVYDRIAASFYAGLHRHVFALSIAWIIFAGVHGYGGPVNQFLSWRGWIPLSKLTYSTFLCHYIILLYNSGSVRTANHLTSFNVTHIFFGHLVLSVFLSVILSLVFEMPFMVLHRILTTNLRRSAGPQGTRKTFQNSGSNNTVYKSTDDTTMTVSQIYTDIIEAARNSPDYVYDSSRNVSEDFYVNEIERPRIPENTYTSIMGSTYSNDNAPYASQGLYEEQKFDTRVYMEQRKPPQRDNSHKAGKSADNKAFEDTS